MPVTIEDVAHDAATGVLRALDARRAGAKNVAAEDLSAAHLVRSGFGVNIHITAGGITAAPPVSSELNPQPLPPRQQVQGGN